MSREGKVFPTSDYDQQLHIMVGSAMFQKVRERLFIQLRVSTGLVSGTEPFVDRWAAMDQQSTKAKRCTAAVNAKQKPCTTVGSWWCQREP
jgi:hypothetical protein